MRDPHISEEKVAAYLSRGNGRSIACPERRMIRRSSLEVPALSPLELESVIAEHQQEEAGGRVSVHQIGNRITFGKEPRGGLPCQFP